MRASHYRVVGAQSATSASSASRSWRAGCVNATSCRRRAQPTGYMPSDTIRSIVRAYDDPVVRAYCWARFLVLRQRFLEEIGQYLPPAAPGRGTGCGFGLLSLYYPAPRPPRFPPGAGPRPRPRPLAPARALVEHGGADGRARARGLRCAAPPHGGRAAVSARALYLRGAAVTQAPLLVAHGLTAGYGKMDILQDVSLEVHAGEIVGVIGPNGAGKSTAFKTIVGFPPPRRGRVIFNGQEITGVRPDLVLRRGLAYVPQGRIVFPQMTVPENLEMGAYTERDPARVAGALERVYALFPILGERRRQKAGTMSGGEQQMVAIARALMTSPRLILLDEPSLRLSPKFLTLIFHKLLEMKRGGFTLMVVEQNATRALGIAARAGGKAVAHDPLPAPPPSQMPSQTVVRR